MATFSDKTGLGDLMKKAQEMQKQMQSIQTEVSAMEVTGASGGNLVSVIMTGRYRVTRITLDPGLMKEEKSMVEDLIAAAINDAVTKIEQTTRSKMTSLTGIKLPEGFNLPEGV